ncbi:hypothetical protein CERZMDRAFT_97107 [Cercospora zeae-maydis SCOH1-5]|uniref:Uncharacterized protein n=1 Tax=Cercospora zeae-maydis SCOH1-5 TaxID=717836 RepID=A0A6A6FGM2_9PEZI|nr:hypothetical protein CERZMDRAFT_97107 [Cercospora zeae-maydis SCOH1-5]
MSFSKTTSSSKAPSLELLENTPVQELLPNLELLQASKLQLPLTFKPQVARSTSHDQASLESQAQSEGFFVISSALEQPHLKRPNPAEKAKMYRRVLQLNPGIFRLSVQLPSGKTLTMWVCKHNTIDSLARNIALLEHVRPEDIRLGKMINRRIEFTERIRSRVQWLWEPIVPGRFRGDWGMELANLKEGSRVFVEFAYEMCSSKD